MLPPEDRLPTVRTLIDEQSYFVVHAPRQSGKSTCFPVDSSVIETFFLATGFSQIIFDYITIT